MNTFDACMRLAEFASERHSGRREYEWKVSLGLWAATLTAIATWKGHRLPWTVVIVTGVLYGFFWLRGIWVANENDKQVSLHYRRAAEDLLNVPDDEDIQHLVAPPDVTLSLRRTIFGFLFDWSMLFQFLTTLGLLVLARMYIA